VKLSPVLKATKNAKVPFGKAKASPIKNVRYLGWEDGFPVAPKRSEGGFVHYDNGQTAEVSWSFIRELPPKNSKK